MIPSFVRAPPSGRREDVDRVPVPLPETQRGFLPTGLDHRQERRGDPQGVRNVVLTDAGEDPDGYMGMSELVQFMQDYAEHSHAPVLTNTNVTSVRKKGAVYYVTTDRGAWVAKAVIVASGACNTPSVPAVARDVPANITQLTAHDYRSPAQIAPGGVLVVGASATGMQIADELLQAGHEVNMAVGEHVRMPRHYRDRNILDWMDHCGILSERYDEVEDIARGRRLPSSQLVVQSPQAFRSLVTSCSQPLAGA